MNSKSAQSPSAYRQVMDLNNADTMWLAGYLSRSAPEIVLEALEHLRNLKAQGRA